MKTQLEKNKITMEKKLFVKMVVDAWDAQNKNVNKQLDTLSDEQLQAETAPGKKSGVYLLGHIIAVSDGLLPILGFGERLQPKLEDIFLKNPENLAVEKPSIDELKQYWNEIIAKLETYFDRMTADDWFAKHTAVSDEDFAKEPHRNKLNIIISRTNHQSYHLGQLALLTKK